MEKTVAKCLLEIKSVFYDFQKPYLSGTGQRMPIYCDNRLILSYPRVRKVMMKWLGNLVKEAYPDVEMVMGTAPAGIAFATLISEALGIPMGYVLNAKKDHAFQNRVEGVLKKGGKVVIVDDVILTGHRLVDVAHCLIQEDCVVLGAVAIVSYELEQAKALLQERHLPYKSLTTYSQINEIALQTGKINYQEFQKAIYFKLHPESDEWMNQ